MDVHKKVTTHHRTINQRENLTKWGNLLLIMKILLKDGQIS